MTMQSMKKIIRKNFIYYSAGFLILFTAKAFYSQADCDMLKWILAPTKWWVSILSGIPFWYESGIGYVNYSLKFIIAASCSGVSFMIITIATLIFSFIHRFCSPSEKITWMAGSIGFSYLFTVFINGLRIILAIYIPLYLTGMPVYSRYLTQERLHTLIGTVVYFTALLILYHLADFLFEIKNGIFSKNVISDPGDSCSDRPIWLYAVRKCTPPVFWYFFLVLGVPFLNRTYHNNYTGFAAYAILITAVCLFILLLVFASFIMRKYLSKLRKLI